MMMMMIMMMMQGNTRERTWVDQQMKTLHVTKENHRALDTITRVSEWDNKYFLPNS